MTTTLPLETSTDSPPRQEWWYGLIAPIVYAALVICLLHEVLFSGGAKLLSSESTDLAMQFLPWRDFGFSQMRQGHLPLWNPYIYGGTPYFAGFQSALLYPPNWLHLFLSVPTAINWQIALHIFLAGYFMYLWGRSRGISMPGSFLAGIMFMFSGAYYLHVYAGHLPHLCLMPWVPLVWIAVEKLSQTGNYKWLLAGIPAMAMVILAGHPQYVYYTGIVTGLYVLMLLIKSKHRLALFGGSAAIVGGASLLVAIQLLTGAQAASEGVRSGGTDYAFASMFALPPENLLTLIAPTFFGGLGLKGDPPDAIQYFGRCYLWEMSLYVSVAGFCMAIYAVLVNWRKQLILSVLVVLTLILALGKHLPLYDFLYHYLPAFDSFRCVAKFTFFTTILLSIIAGDGLDALLERRESYSLLWIMAGAAAVGAVCILAYGVAISSSGGDGVDGTWGRVLSMIDQSHESYFPANAYGNTDFIRRSALVAFSSSAWAAGLLALVAAMFVASRFRSECAYGLLALAIVEMGVFAVRNRAEFDPAMHYPQAWLDVIHKGTGDFRVLNASLPGGADVNYLDDSLALGIQNLWGYDPGVLKRYAELMAVSQGGQAKDANQYQMFLPQNLSRTPLGIFQMLRCKFILLGGSPPAVEVASPLPVAQLVNRDVVLGTRDEVLDELMKSDFNPRSKVVLETEPSIPPSAEGPNGPTDEIVRQTTDSLELKANVSAPVILLITNNYSPGWHVKSLEPSGQDHYEIQPANYTQMAIPLAKGSHHLLIEYIPTAFRVGRVISIVSLLSYLSALVWWLLRLRRVPAQSAV